MTIASNQRIDEVAAEAQNGQNYRLTYERAMAKAAHPSGLFEPFAIEDIELSIPERFAKTVRAYPNRIALQDGADVMTFTQLNSAANVVAHHLIHELGAESEPVAILFDHGMEMVVALLGILKAGKFYVPLSPHDPPSRWQQVLTDVEPKMLITDANNEAPIRGLSTNCEILPIASLDFDDQAPDPDIDIAPDAYAYVLFTSGSTGVPKGVIGLHRNVLRFSRHIINQSRLCAYDRTAMLQSIAFSGSLAALYPPLFVGAVACFFDVHKAGVHRLPDWFVREQITYFIGGAIFRAMTDFLDDESHFPELRVIYGGGGASYRHHFETYKRVTSERCIYVSSLSTTEVSGISRLWLDKEFEPEGDVVPAGYTDDDLEVLIWDEDGNPVDEGEAGEIVVRTQYVSPGYWRRPELTAERFPADPDIPGQHVYRTGDLGRIREDGCIVHMGRIDHQVKVRGQRVEIGEVEACLLNMGEVRECVVHAIKNDQGVQLVAYVVGVDASPDIQQLRQSLAALLPDYAVPQRFVAMDALPRLLTGKVDYKALPAPGRERPDLATPYAPPSSELEERLVQLWAEVLDIESVGIDDRFTDLGGDSLSAVRLLAALEEMSGRTLPFAVIAEASNVRELAALLDEEQAEPQWRTLVRIQPGNSRPPLFLVPPSASTSIGFNQLAQRLGDEQPVYGFDPLGMNGDEEPQRSVEEMAALYVSEIKQVQPEGPYYLGGRCFGALVAQEMTRQLEQQGDRVNLLAIMDSGAIQAQRELREKNSTIPLHKRAAGKLLYESRKLYKTFMQLYGPPEARPSEIDKRTRKVMKAHTAAWRYHDTKPIHARMLVMVSSDFGRSNRHNGWQELTDGAYSEHISEFQTHKGFLSDPDNLDFVADLLRQALEEAAC